jgi:hypothetical protein
MFPRNRSVVGLFVIVSIAVVSGVWIASASASAASAKAAPHAAASAPGLTLALGSAIPHSSRPVFIKPAAAFAPQLASNPLLDADIQLDAYGQTFSSVAAEGHLLLKLHGTRYRGSFTDNFAGAKVFPASEVNPSASGIDGTYTIHTGNGTFKFTYGDTPKASAPSKYGKDASMDLAFNPHVYTQSSPMTLTLNSTTFGGLRKFLSGALTLTTDDLGYIVPFSSKLHVNSSLSYVSGGHLYGSKMTTSGLFRPVTAVYSGSVTMSVKVGRSVYHIADAGNVAGASQISSSASVGSDWVSFDLTQ